MTPSTTARVRRSTPRRVRVAAACTSLLGLVGGLLGAGATAPAAANPVTPGNLTGYGFDQCEAPSQAAMTRWMETSPFLAVGIYISGASRGCREQRNLTPQWVSTQLAQGWELLPITLGPQASCSPHFPRYGNDPTINPTPGAGNNYTAARAMGRTEGQRSVDAARRLGIAPRSVLWYDMEAFDVGNTHCRESALAFVSAWNTTVKRLGFTTGLYSSAGSGLNAWDDARVNRPGRYVMPQYIWFARWDEVANSSTSYLREDGWRPNRRVKQYRGGHLETHGGVTINIDSNWLEVGKGSRALPPVTKCGDVLVDLPRYGALTPGAKGRMVSALQCNLRMRGFYSGEPTGRYDDATGAAVAAYRRDRGMDGGRTWGRTGWVRLASEGARPVLKLGSNSWHVRRVQRMLNATGLREGAVDAYYDREVADAVKQWQARVKQPQTGIVTEASWRAMSFGRGV
ncbi:glycoside hydrolase domain-containing protein [Nocardioides sp. CFH 31398]|uniref:glycoside hydrolase domain-containing protein n=1 Tax=Nocardioides sp. CFH 31398 TaxID=2919579 RepID=UPI001F058CC2|nr:glycoside hydrolase domain-containing protein [Nocardioides sp. CFH 31398]MCH1865118.1 DUF1906 domain-containing protein [Nocardioides sp. CFH 31398]